MYRFHCVTRFNLEFIIIYSRSISYISRILHIYFPTLKNYDDAHDNTTLYIIIDYFNTVGIWGYTLHYYHNQIVILPSRVVHVLSRNTRLNN